MAGPIGLIAGRGNLPVRVAESARAGGRDVFVARLKGFEEPALAAYPGEVIGLGEWGKLVRTLKSAGCRELVFAGNVSRPDFSALKVDLRGARLLPRVLMAARQGDDALLRVIVSELEAEGFTIRGAEEIAGSLLAPQGLIAGRPPGEADWRDIHRAAEVAREIGRLDIGQGCVVVDGLVLAVEAQEGTDRMLDRVAGLDPALRGSAPARRGVLVKVPKPIQEKKIDLPTLGVETVLRASRAGLAGIAVEAGGALLVDLAQIVEAANREQLFLIGLDQPA